MQQQIEQVIAWLKKIYGEKPAVVAVSGGVDSAVVLTLLVRALGKERVQPILLPYREQDMTDAKTIVNWNGYQKFEVVNIGEVVDLLIEQLGVEGKVRKGNLMARVRMITVFDRAKKMDAMVCGTENKSERMLGYYTRFGDAASDVEPISHWYKTEVWEAARELGLPEIFYTKAPSAGLWEGQTDEVELGFSYREADLVLQGKVEGVRKEVVEVVRMVVARNKFKSEVPYVFGEIDVSAV